MKSSIITLILLASMATIASQVWGAEPIVAFPGAEGEGRWSLGGRGGDVYHVTNLYNDGLGSLRYGIENVNGPRTIVFDISGTIEITNYIKVDEPYLTIAGQTAPGDGICIKGWGFLVKNTHDVIIRHMRFRTGHELGFLQDALNINGDPDSTYNIIIDHCSVSWGLDECLSATEAIDKVTVQWCIISEGLDIYDHSRGTLCRVDFQDGKISFHHNLWAHHFKRLPRVGSYNHYTLWADLRNNIMYNWVDEAATIAARSPSENPHESHCNLNYINNYIIRGPSTEYEGWPWDPKYYAVAGHNSDDCDIYQSGNKLDDDLDGNRDGVDTGWAMFTGDYDPQTVAFNMEPVTTHTTDEAYEMVLARAGALWWKRDSVDQRVVNTVINETGGIIVTAADVGEWPALVSDTPPTDSDNDGIPDFWELTHGQPHLVASNNYDSDMDGYTDLENYINAIPIIAATDAYQDNFINFEDFAVVAEKWNQSGCKYSNNFCQGADINISGEVDEYDMLQFADYWLEQY